MIEQLIENSQYEEALKLLEGKDDDKSNYQRIVCYYGLSKFDEVIKLSKDVLSKEAKNYYDVMSLYIAALTATDNDEEAMKLLEQELTMPYIPYKYADLFNDTYDYLIKKRAQNNKVTTPYSSYNTEELSTIILLGENNDVVIQAIIELRARNIRLFIEPIKAYLKDLSKPRFIKVLLLESLVLQSVDLEVLFLTDDEEIIINPSKLDEIVTDKIYDLFIESFNNALLSKDPTLYEYCLDVLPGYLGLIYPKAINEDDINLIAAAIHLYVSEVANLNVSLEELSATYSEDIDSIKEMAHYISENLSAF